MNSKIKTSIFLLALLTTGCISEFNAKLPSSDQQILIVDGSITANTEAMFYISKSFSLDSLYDPKKNITNAKLTLIGDNGYQSQPAIHYGNGEYRMFVGNLDDNVSYGIQIEYDGDIYQSTLSKPLHTPEIDSVSWIQPEKAGTIFFRVSTHDNEAGAKFFIWDYTENWEITAFYYTTIFVNTAENTFYNDFSAPYYYCWRKAASDKFIIGSTESLSENRIINKLLIESSPRDNRFSTLYSINVNQKAISKSAYEYYQNKITLNEEMGGLFTPQPSELSGNISCKTNTSKKVLGYVEVSKNTTQKRIFVNRAELTYPPAYNDCVAITHDSLLIIMAEYHTDYAGVYSMGYRPISLDDRKYPELLPYEWSRSPCTECTANGGSKIKPDFWPNDHK